MHEDVQLHLDTEISQGCVPVLETVEKDHGRIETQRYSLSTQIDWLEKMPISTSAMLSQRREARST